MSRALLLALPLGLAGLTGCGGDAEKDPSTGTVSVRAFGEAFIEEGIPADAGHDGWIIEFNNFHVTFQDILVAGVALEDPDAVDLAVASGGEGHELGALEVATGEHAEPSFAITRVEAVGSATDGDAIKTFSWVFDSLTHYEHCEASTKVEKDATAIFQITVHADHLFYDSLVSEEPQLLFQPLADADADQDGDITTEELGATDIGAYDPGNEDLDDLWSFLMAQSRTLGHVDGEGHCQASATD